MRPEKKKFAKSKQKVKKCVEELAEKQRPKVTYDSERDDCTISDSEAYAAHAAYAARVQRKPW